MGALKKNTSQNLLILPLLVHIPCKRLQIGTGMLLIITSTGEELQKMSTSMTTNDPEPPR